MSAEPRIPPLFGSAIPRQCTRWIGKGNCGAEPVMHVDWGAGWGFVCREHVDELGTVWVYVQAHEVGPDCGMPGAYWHVEENVCRCDDGLDTEVCQPEIALSGENGGGGNRTRVTCPTDSPLSSENTLASDDDPPREPLVTRGAGA